MSSGSKLFNRRVPSLHCIVVNWNGWQDTLLCLASLEAQDYPSLHVIVVDNHSTNDSVAQLKAIHPNLVLLQSSVNVGFSGGNNIGIRHALSAGADFVWLLNNDTVAPPDTASKLVAKALSCPTAGAIGTVLHYMDAPERVQAWGGGSFSLHHGGNTHFTAARSFGKGTFLTGASLLLRSEALHQVGLLDQAFFMYCEDVDFSFRLRKAGWDIVVAEDTAVLHKENASSGRKSPLMDRYSTASAVTLLKRYSSAPRISVFLHLVAKLLNRVRRGEWQRFKAVIEGLNDACKATSRESDASLTSSAPGDR
jgi:GT2 family glycosyltransferase